MQHNNLVATVWNDAKPVHIASTTSGPFGDGPAQRRIRGGGVIIIQRPPAVEYYQQHNYGVDRTQQYRSKCPVGRPSKKFWKYLINYIFEIFLINTFLLQFETPGTRKPTKHFSMVDCNLSIAEKLTDDFSSRKRTPSCGRGVASISVANINRHISTKLTRPRGRCKQCKKNGRRSDTFFGCSICNVHLCRGACFQAYHTYHHLPMEQVYISCNICLYMHLLYLLAPSTYLIHSNGLHFFKCVFVFCVPLGHVFLKPSK